MYLVLTLYVYIHVYIYVCIYLGNNRLEPQSSRKTHCNKFLKYGVKQIPRAAGRKSLPGLGCFRVQGLAFRVLGLGFRVCGLWFWLLGLGSFMSLQRKVRAPS